MKPTKHSYRLFFLCQVWICFVIKLALKDVREIHFVVANSLEQGKLHNLIFSFSVDLKLHALNLD